MRKNISKEDKIFNEIKRACPACKKRQLKFVYRPFPQKPPEALRCQYCKKLYYVKWEPIPYGEVVIIKD